VAFALDGVLVGAGAFRAVTVITVWALVIFVPAIGVVSAVPSCGIVGIWAALTVWMLMRAVLAWRAGAAHLWAR
jgi:Na+-driven multidrug efflux pump